MDVKKRLSYSNKLRLKAACYSSNVSMAVVSSLSPLLLLSFRRMYNISYSLLGLLVFISFFTQLLFDLLLSFFSHKVNKKKIIKIMPVLGVVGLCIYGLSPLILSDNIFIGLCIGTVVFSASSGLGEVLISPIIASIPTDNPEREMSVLHSVYAWGVVAVVLVSTAFIRFAGEENWQILVFILALVPLASFCLFFGEDIPLMETEEKTSGVLELIKNKEVCLFVTAIFAGGAAECTMAQWASGYIEKAIGIPKILGDIFGVALFSAMLGMGRSLYGKMGKNIYRVMIWGSLGAVTCYILAALSPLPLVGLLACATTGLFVSMLWPGNLLLSAERIPKGGVVLYALMASGGDLGASVGPQIVGIITDSVLKNEKIISFSDRLGISLEQLGMKAGMLVGVIFPLISFLVCVIIKRRNSKID